MNIIESWPLNHRPYAFFLRTCSSLMLAIFFAAALSACNESGGNDDGDQTDGDEQTDVGEDEDDPIDNGDNETGPPSVMLFNSPAAGGTGNELWISDGTADGTSVLKDINSAGGDSEPGPFTAVDDTVFFAAKTDADGRELWKTDGTEAGTLLVADINPGPGNSSPRNLTAFNGELYFTADVDSTGWELWKSDGTAAGTVLVRDINSGSGSSTPTELIAFDGALYFAADDGTDDRVSQRGALWKTDGTELGTQKLRSVDLSSGIEGRVLVMFKGELFFTASEEFSAREIWKTDGTVAGTVQVSQIVDDDENSSNPIGLTVFENELYFQAKRKETGAELWKTDGTEAGTVVVTNINPCDGCSTGSSSDSVPRNLTPFNGMLYFTATNPELGRELWKTDGSVDGAQLVKDIREGDQSSINAGAAYLTVFDGALYFTADNGETGRELWKTDGTEAGTLLVKNLNLNTTSAPRELTVFNDRLYLTARTTSTEIYKTDGTEAGTNQVTSIDYFSFYPEHTFITP